GPAGDGDDLGIIDGQAAVAQSLRHHHGPARIRRHAFADSVGVAQCQVTPRRVGHRHTAATCSRAPASAMRPRVRSMRVNTSARTSGSGSNVRRRWRLAATLKLEPGASRTDSSSNRRNAKALSSNTGNAVTLTDGKAYSAPRGATMSRNSLAATPLRTA